MWAARVVCWGFDLGEDAGYRVLADHYNPRCEPPWTEAELRKKCRDAVNPDFQHPRAWLLNAEGDRPPARTPATPAADPTPGPTAGATAPKPLTTIRNYAIRYGDDGNEVGRNSLTPQQVTREILRATGGWPKACGGRLFVPGPDHTPLWLDDATTFFGWLAGHVGQTGGLVEWGRGEGQINKPEFYGHLARSVERFGDVQTFPHWPARPGTYYMHPELPAGGSGAFGELLDRLRPAGPADHYLIRAFFLTLGWGGKLGGRPIFIFEALAADGRPGHGAGKSTAAMLAGDLFGGYVGISLATADDLQVQTRLLSEDGMACRLVVFDNLKGTRVSNSLVESYVTAKVISGRKLYVGEGKRPNTITWAITANQPSISHDFTERAYPVRLNPPRYSPEWNNQTEHFVADNRWQIIADIVAELRGDPSHLLADGEWSRWPEWERDVLCKVCDPRTIAGVVKDRRCELDDDSATATTVRDALFEYLRGKGHKTPETLHLSFTVAHLTEAIGRLCPHGNSPISVGRWLNAMTIPGLTKRRDKHARYWVWKGEEALCDEPILWDEIPA